RSGQTVNWFAGQRISGMYFVKRSTVVSPQVDKFERLSPGRTVRSSRARRTGYPSVFGLRARSKRQISEAQDSREWPVGTESPKATYANAVVPNVTVTTVSRFGLILHDLLRPQPTRSHPSTVDPGSEA